MKAGSNMASSSSFVQTRGDTRWRRRIGEAPVMAIGSGDPHFGCVVAQPDRFNRGHLGLVRDQAVTALCCGNGAAFPIRLFVHLGDCRPVADHEDLLG